MILSYDDCFFHREVFQVVWEEEIQSDFFVYPYPQ